MKYDFLKILGVTVLVGFGQGLIRILTDPDDLGLLHWLPGGPAPALLAHAVLTIAGVALTSWAHSQSKTLSRRT
ncbi:hypothetical protein ABT354_33810 [Streptomyces sp. NPDC000594]|uniref:hypothetical protein n=1 Tax=Streptomyces sp. NPDC000594 TaxID=3154261 RepID=UPI00332E1977